MATKVRYIVEGMVGLACAGAFLLFADYQDARLYGLANTLATVSGVLFGFLLTAIAMLVTLPERRLVANMRVTGHFRVLIRGTLLACSVHFMGLALALAAAFSQGGFLGVLVSLALAVEVFAILRTVESGIRFSAVLDAMESNA